jgi:hypothetical protein
MYVGKATYECVSSYVLGFDAALEGAVLIGFREWLVVRLGLGNNLTWQSLVLSAAFPAALDPEAMLVSAQAHQHAIDTLFASIDTFEEERAKQGLVSILSTHRDWVEKQRSS